MLVTNEPSDSQGAEQTTLNLAKTTGAQVLLVDSLRTPFQRKPVDKPVAPNEIYDAALASKKEYLQGVQTRLADDGVKASMQILLGARTSTELIRTAQENHCDLVVRYLKGQSSRAQGRFGETAENLIRACPVPVLLVEREVQRPKVVACINLEHGHEENQAILENARKLVQSPQDLFVLCCWEFSGNEFVIDYVDEGLLDQTKNDAKEVFSQLFEELLAEYKLDDLEGQVFLKNEKPENEIPQFCQDNQIDIAVMCSASLNHPLGRKMGSTIRRTIGSLPCALLTVKPIGFDSTFAIEESALSASTAE